jgi:hypothetical protein
LGGVYQMAWAIEGKEGAQALVGVRLYSLPRAPQLVSQPREWTDLVPEVFCQLSRAPHLVW